MFFQNLFATRPSPSSETFSTFLSALNIADELAAAGGVEKHGDTLPVSLKANPPPKPPPGAGSGAGGVADGGAGGGTGVKVNTNDDTKMALHHHHRRKSGGKKVRRDPSILISADGLVLDETTTDIVKSLDKSLDASAEVENPQPLKPPQPPTTPDSPSTSTSPHHVVSEYDSLRVGSDEPNGDYLSNGFSMHSLPQMSVTNCLSSTSSALAMQLTHLQTLEKSLKKASSQIKQVRACEERKAKSANAAALALTNTHARRIVGSTTSSQSLAPINQATNQTHSSTPLFQTSTSLNSALSAYSLYIDESYASLDSSLSHYADVIHGRLGTSSSLLSRRAGARSAALEECSKKVAAADASLARAKANAARKREQMRQAQLGSRVPQGNARGAQQQVSVREERTRTLTLHLRA